jgi:hypothetical protein
MIFLEIVPLIFQCDEISALPVLVNCPLNFSLAVRNIFDSKGTTFMDTWKIPENTLRDAFPRIASPVCAMVRQRRAPGTRLIILIIPIRHSLFFIRSA